MKRSLIVLLCYISFGIMAANISKVIELNYQNANTVIKLIQPLLSNGDRVSGEGQTLVVNVSPATLTKIRAVLHRIDTPPVTFLVSVYQGDPDWLASRGRNTRIISTNSTVEQQRYQSVQVTNGESAFISTGTDQPEISSVGIGFWNTGVSYNRRLVQNGLLVEPVLQGSRVKLTVRRVREQNSLADNQSYDEQQVATTLMVPLDQWVSLATAQGAPAASPKTRVYRAGYTYGQNSTLYIKVDVVAKQPARLSK